VIAAAQSDDGENENEQTQTTIDLHDRSRIDRSSRSHKAATLSRERAYASCDGMVRVA
jgi:hypothetical protein